MVEMIAQSRAREGVVPASQLCGASSLPADVLLLAETPGSTGTEFSHGLLELRNVDWEALGTQFKVNTVHLGLRPPI
jgi:hypothetical protein